MLPCADVGAGSAHLTKLLVARGCNVAAVEPNDAMRAVGMRVTANKPVQWHVGTGEATGQPDNAFDAVTFGSSFNTTDRPEALRETQRILRPNGWFACLWNHRDLNHSLQAEVERLHQEPHRRLRLWHATRGPNGSHPRKWTLRKTGVHRSLVCGARSGRGIRGSVALARHAATPGGRSFCGHHRRHRSDHRGTRQGAGGGLYHAPVGRAIEGLIFMKHVVFYNLPNAGASIVMPVLEEFAKAAGCEFFSGPSETGKVGGRCRRRQTRLPLDAQWAGALWRFRGTG